MSFLRNAERIRRNSPTEYRSPQFQRRILKFEPLEERTLLNASPLGIEYNTSASVDLEIDFQEERVETDVVEITTNLILSTISETTENKTAGANLNDPVLEIPEYDIISSFEPAQVPILQMTQATDAIGLIEYRTDDRFENFNGAGYSVVVIDSGINSTHDYFKDAEGNSRIVYQYDFADDDPDATDFNGHGTHTTSIAAGWGEYGGIAPEANIIALKVFGDSSLAAYSSDISEALQWVIENQDEYNIVSVNMSIGNNQTYSSPPVNAPYTSEIDTLAENGVIVCVSSGNAFYKANSQTGLSSPAIHPSVVSVGAVYDANVRSRYYANGARAYSTDVDRICPFTSRHPELLTIMAPGALSTSAWIGSDSIVATNSGTSQASPVVAGAAVLAQQLANEYLGRSLTVAEFKELIQETGDLIFDGDDEDDNVENTNAYYKRINVYNLAEAIYEMRYSDVGDTLATAKNVPLPRAEVLPDTSYSKVEKIGNGTADAKDVDMYKVQMDVGFTYTFATSPHTEETAVDTYLRLFDADGVEILVSNDAEGESHALLTYQPTVAGEYYLGVSSNGNREYTATTAASGTDGATGDYLLAITRECILEPLNAPMSLSATALGTDAIRVTWDAVPNASGYTLEIAQDESFTIGAKKYETSSASSTSARIFNLSANTTYYFRMTTVGTGLYKSSEVSEVVSATTDKITLATPTLVVVPAGNYEINVTIGTVQSATAYQLEYSLSEDFTNATIDTYDSAGEKTISSLEHGKLYYFRVRALGGESANSSDFSSLQTGYTSFLAEKEVASTVVTTALDIVNEYDGLISLREAISYASAGDTISFDESMINQTITLNGTELRLDKAVGIDGNGMNITIDAGFESRVLNIDFNSRTRVVIAGLTFVNGKNDAAAGVRIGKNVSYVTLVNCVVAKNDGDGITLEKNNALTLTNCTIVGNSGVGVDGGKLSYVINNSIISRNLAFDIVGRANVTNSLVGTRDTSQRQTLRNTQVGVDPGFSNLPSYATYDEWRAAAVAAATADWDLTLSATSAARDAGDVKLFTNTGMPQTADDALGNARISGSKIDIGACEFQENTINSPQLSVQKAGSKIVVSWDAVPFATSYVVNYRVAGATSWTTKNLRSNGTSLTISGRVGSTYEIRVAAVSSEGNSKAATGSVTLYAPLTTPKLASIKNALADDAFAIQVTNYASHLEKDAATMTIALNGESVSFDLENHNGDADFSGGETVKFEAGVLYFANLASYTNYKVEVMFANDRSGSAFVSTSVRTTKATFDIPIITNVKTLSATEIEVSWEAVTGKNSSTLATNYTIQTSTDGKTWRSGATTSRGATTCVLKRLASGTEYQIRVIAAADRTFLASEPSKFVPKTTAVATPTISSVLSRSVGSAAISWNNIKGAAKYEIQYRAAGSDTWSPSIEVDSTNARSYSLTIDDLTSGAKYEFRIRAISSILPDVLSSGWSGVKTLWRVR
ncbi:MAG: S8 family serine peptidase [Planctomycetia bacterium]|nr:S8 family serine peptidase [Planctomycetia bacterium]